ncbi:hypothetical protein XANCAGTX0491_000057 [Xanthoria calcicola]
MSEDWTGIDNTLCKQRILTNLSSPASYKAETETIAQQQSAHNPRKPELAE